MKPSQALAEHRDAVRLAVARSRADNPRVFGSVAAGADRDGSDLDLLVDARPGTTLFDLGALQVELEELLGVPVDVVTSRDLPERFREGLVRGAADLTVSRTPDYLDHIRRAAADAIAFVDGLPREDFLADRRTQQAVIMSLIIIGEAATKIMDGDLEYARSRPEIPWRAMRGMRNRIAHGYFEINLDVVWDTVQSALPDLLATLGPD